MIDPSLKVLFCAFQVIPEPSGASTRVTEFLRALQGKCTVDALTAKSPDVGHIERYLGARLMRVPVGAGDLAARSQAFERAVSRQLDSDEYQIIQFSDPFAGTALLDHKAKLRFKLVYDACTFPSFDLRFTDPHLEGDRSFMAKLKRSELLCLMGADAVVVPSPVTRDHVVSLGVPKQKITVIPPALDLKAYEKLAGARPDRIPMRLLYLGSQVAWQGLPTLLFALKDALKQPAASGMRLSIVGPRHPDWRDQLEEQVKASGLSGNVDFLEAPTREDLPRLIAQHDVGVAPLEKSERNVLMGGAVMKVAEYAAAGRAILASDLPVLRALVDERAASFFPPSRESALSAAMVALAKEPMKRVQMGQAARALALERFDTARSAEKLLTLYASFKLRGVTHTGEHEVVDAPTSVGAQVEDTGSRRGFDEPTGVGAALPEAPPPAERDADTGQVRLAEAARDADTGEVRLAQPASDPSTGNFAVAQDHSRDEPTGQIRLPPEPTPVGVNLVSPPSVPELDAPVPAEPPPELAALPELAPDAHAAPPVEPEPVLEAAPIVEAEHHPEPEAALLPPPPAFEVPELPPAVTPEPPQPPAPALFSEELPASPTGELPILSGSSMSGIAVVGELLPEPVLEPASSLPFEVSPPPPGPISLPPELFGLPAEASAPESPPPREVARPVSAGEFLPPGVVRPAPDLPLVAVAPPPSRIRPPSAGAARPPSTGGPVVPPVLAPVNPARPPSSGGIPRPLPGAALRPPAVTPSAPPVLTPSRPPSGPQARPPSAPGIPPAFSPPNFRITPPPMIRAAEKTEPAGPPMLAPSGPPVLSSARPASPLPPPPARPPPNRVTPAPMLAGVTTTPSLPVPPPAAMRPPPNRATPAPILAPPALAGTALPPMRQPVPPAAPIPVASVPPAAALRPPNRAPVLTPPPMAAPARPAGMPASLGVSMASSKPPAPAGPPVVQPAARPAVSEVLELGDADFASVDDPPAAEPDFVEADAIEPVEAPKPPTLQNSVDLGGPDTWVNSLVLGFAPLGQLGAAPIRGSPLSTEPPKV